MKKSPRDKRIIRAYKQGMTLRDITRHFDVSYDVIERTLCMDRQYARDVVKRYQYPLKRFVELYTSQTPINDIMDALGLSYRDVSRLRQVSVTLGYAQWRITPTPLTQAAIDRIEQVMDTCPTEATMGDVVDELTNGDYKPAIRYIRRTYGTTLTEWRNAYRYTLSSFSDITGVNLSSVSWWYRKKLFTLPWDDAQLTAMFERGMAMRRDIRLDTGFAEVIRATRHRLKPKWMSRHHVAAIVKREGIVRYIGAGMPHVEFPGSWDNCAYDRVAMVDRIRQLIGRQAAIDASDYEADWLWLT